MLQLSVHILEIGGPALLTKFWQSLPEALALPGCHVTPSTDGEAFLFWTPGSTPLAWSPAAGLPPAVDVQCLHLSEQGQRAGARPVVHRS